MKQKIITNFSRCRGCRTCELMCALAHGGEPNPRVARIRVFQDLGTCEPRVCAQCEEPKCMEACPEGAISFSQSRGSIVVSDVACTGCGACLHACPFHAIWLHPTTATALICDLCGGDPRCVAACPFEALALGLTKDSLLGVQ